MQALAQRVHADGQQAGVDRLTVSGALSSSSLADRLQRVQAQLPEPLALAIDPVVVPVREQVAGQVAVRSSAESWAGRVERRGATRRSPRRTVDVDAVGQARCVGVAVDQRQAPGGAGATARNAGSRTSAVLAGVSQSAPAT